MTPTKTALALAIGASLVSVSAISADKYQKYNFTNQAPVTVKQGSVEVDKLVKKPSAWLVKLNASSLAETAVNGKLSKSAGENALAKIEKVQAEAINAVQALSDDIEIISHTRNLVSGLIVKGDEKVLSGLLSHSAVNSLVPIYDYEISVDESANYMKGTALVESGVASGEGVRVAVLDTGVDYTHAAMGGEGTAEAYEAAIADTADTPAWPQGQVVGGYDFYSMDPDPIDAGTSHGTHVSHSVLGLAPDAELYVYSVCAGGCPGTAQLMALEASMDPNGDGDIADRVDVINMSLGGDFGSIRGGAVQELLDKAALLGVNAAISAGNDGPTPFIVGGPSTTKNVMSVGAMTHPTTTSGFLDSMFNGEEIEAVAAGFNRDEDKAFSFTDADSSLVYPDANQEGCDAFADGTDFTGKIVLIDRGSCNFTAKVINAQDKGAVFVLIANHTAGAGAPGLGGSDSNVAIPSAGISYEDGMAIKEALMGTDAITFSFVSTEMATTGAIASFTSRGPNVNGLLKPEITAPGVAIDTAYPGGGTDTSPINGTSFSSPMTAGAMALLKEALPNRTALELKATLMNTADLDVTMEPRTLNADAALAPISYIGAGLVDVEKAANLPVAAWNKDTMQAALSYGLVNLSETTAMTKTVTVKNFSSEAKMYTLSIDQRFADDMESGAVSFDHPSSVTVPAGGTYEFDVTLTVDPSKLPEWTLTADKLASIDGTDDLTVSEYDGALVFTDGDDNFHMVYHVLPKASASVDVMPVITDEGVVRHITNNGVVDLEAFAVPLTVEDEMGESDYLDLTAASVEVLEVPTDFCASGYAVYTTFTLSEGILSTNVGGVYLDYDIDGDGAYDFSSQALPLDAFGYDMPGTTVTFTSAWGTFSGSLNNLYFTSGNNFATTEHCIESIGLAASDLGTMNSTLRFRVTDGQYDFYSSYALDDAMTTGFDFAVSEELVMLVDAEGESVETLAVGETAQILTSGKDFVFLSNSGSEPLVAAPTQDAGVAPVVTEGQMFDVDENTENGTVIGKVMATDPDLFTSPVSEYFVQASSSVAVMMERDGTLKVADSALLDYDAGMTEIVLEVIAVDSLGNISETEEVTIAVNNLADEASEQPAPPAPAPERVEKSSGSFGWISLLALPLVWLRRRKK